MKIVRNEEPARLKGLRAGTVFEILKGTEAGVFVVTDGGWDGHPDRQVTTMRVPDGALCSLNHDYCVLVHPDAEVHIR